MQALLAFLIGFLSGGLCSLWVAIRSARRQAREMRVGYSPAARAVLRYLKDNGTVNHTQVGQLLSVDITAARLHLEQMERDGFLRLHVHANGRGRRKGTFYTPA